MNEEQRDPDLEWIRSYWKPPEPGVALAARVLASYQSHVSATRRNRWMWLVPVPVAVAAVLAFITLSKPAPADYYRAVAQPRFIVVSKGEHP